MNYVQLIKHASATSYQNPVAKNTDEEVVADFQFVMTKSQHENSLEQEIEMLETHQIHDLVKEDSKEEIGVFPVFESLESKTQIASEQEVLPESLSSRSDGTESALEVTELVQNNDISDVVNEVAQPTFSESEKLMVTNPLYDEQMGELVLEINQVLSQIVTGESSTKNIAKLLHLLQRWTNIQHSESETNVVLEKKLPESLAKIWGEMADIYRKRDLMTKNNIYKTNAAITKTDVMNWLQNALERYMPSQESNTIHTYSTSNQPLPLSVLQQHTISLSNVDKVEAISYELVNRLGNVIRNSNFIQQRGLQQLTITLKPETLGDITVRMIQVNGEMTVKLLVTTQVAKGLLEGNIQQLKPMFAPHQIVIERDASISDEEYYQGAQEEASEEQHESLKDREEDRKKETEETPFTEILSYMSEELVEK